MSSTPTRVNPFESLGPLDDFAPKSPPQRTENQPERAAVAQLANEQGFKINNFEETPIPARRKALEPKTFLKTIRIQVSDWNRFQIWCNDKGYSHKKGFQILTESLQAKRA